MRRLLVMLVAGLVAASIAQSPAVAGGGAHCAPDLSDKRTDVVTMAKNCFHPTVARVAVGDEVTFVSEDPVPHTVTGAQFAFGNMDEMVEGDALSLRFDEEGIYPYVCIIHPGMMGAIVVGDGEGPGDGAIVETTAYTAGPSGEEASAAQTRSTVGGQPVAATENTQWPLVVALAAVLAVAGFVGTRRKVTASDEVATATGR